MDVVKIVECCREQDVIAAVVSHRWPERCDADLRDHVAACEICQDVAEVAAAFLVDQDADYQPVRVPSSAHMWWRLQMRARQDAARAALRPINVAQGLVAAAVTSLAVAVIAFGWAATSWSQWSWSEMAAGLQPAANTVVNSVLSVATITPQTTLVLGAIAAGLILMPVAVYFALSE